jgi:hypothetical protein
MNILLFFVIELVNSNVVTPQKRDSEPPIEINMDEKKLRHFEREAVS